MTRSDQSMTSMVLPALTEWAVRVAAEIRSRADSAVLVPSTTSQTSSEEWAAAWADSPTFSTTSLVVAALHAEETRTPLSRDRASATTSTFHSKTQFTAQKPKSHSSTTKLVQSVMAQVAQKAQNESRVRLAAEAVRFVVRQASLPFSRHVLHVAVKEPESTNPAQNAVEQVTRQSQKKCLLQFRRALMTESESQSHAWAM